jgi:phosphatidylinositol alpha-mannosyltransferase
LEAAHQQLKVCIVVPYDVSHEGGVKRHALRVAESLRKQGDQVTVVGPVSGDSVDGVMGFGGVVNIPFNGSANHLAILTSPWSVRRFFRDSEFDVVHIHEPLTPLLCYYAVWFSPRAAHVCTFHMFSESEGRPGLAVRRALSRWLLDRCERGIAVSTPAAEYAERAWRRTMTVIPNGVATGTFRPPDSTARTDGGVLRILFVGNWGDPRKGLRYLLQAHQQLLGRGLSLDLDVVGAGEPPQLAEPRVTYHGPIASEQVLAEYYRNCDLFVAPTTGQESFGMVLLEAMACGRPIVCSDIEGYRQVVDPAGARLVAPRDPEGLAATIGELAGDPKLRQVMGAVNRARAVAFDWDGLAGRVRQQYTAAVAERRGMPLPTTPLRAEA